MSELMINGQKVAFKSNRAFEEVSIDLEGKSYSFNLAGTTPNGLILKMGERLFQVPIVSKREDTHLIVGGKDVLLKSASRKKKKGEGEGHMLSPMPGKILSVLVKSGDSVKKGDTLLIMEAMKMEHAIKASKDGIVVKVFFEEGQQVEGGIELVEMEN
jgi:3-methylcrotonyl-CoA carboxylase alpha subunit